MGDPRADRGMAIGDACAGLRSDGADGIPPHRVQPQVEGLRRDDELDRENPLDPGQDRRGMPRRDRSHRHVILLVRARGDRIRGRGVGQHLVL